ncbi:hypothetical protein ASZ78_005279 [Callipepla squamata]|uniref:Matrix Gla protein n=1 Tax=Callipepla squamata TaxID=9009 RepID=A0A226NC17_CALSU|nr:hypothetical protein ASZ78_005279 [Callipepla squamata]
MRALIVLVLLAALVMAATCYDPFLNRQRANGFIRDDTGLRAILQERIRERNKAPQERQREICEDFYLCEQYALNHGYPAAYRHYFGRRRNK